MNIIEQIKQDIYQALKLAQKQGVLSNLELEEIILTHPKDLKFGDYATNICLKLAKKLALPPNKIFQAIDTYIDKANYQKVEFVSGFINFYLSQEFFQKQIEEILKNQEKFGISNFGANQKILVEHTSVNPNKAMHIGHIRNSILGDSLAKIFQAVGYEVKIENYLDDTGVQVADIVTALLFLDKKYEGKEKFDHFCWDLYTEVQKKLESDENLQTKKREVQTQLEEGKGPYFEEGKKVVERVLKDQLATLNNFSIYYDFIFSESVILQSDLWQNTFTNLKDNGHLVLEKEGVNKDCWVVKDLDLPNKEKMINPDKVFVTSKQNVTYTAKDTAHHLWKFGLVPNFTFNKFITQANGQTLWYSSRGGQEKNDLYQFAKAYAVVDKRQAYNFDVIKAVFKKAGYLNEVNNLHHVAYGLVSLSKETMIELGLPVSDEKDEYQMSGRKGIGVKVDELLDLMIKKVKAKQQENPAQEEEEVPLIEAKEIAAGAVKAYMFKFNLNNDIVFDINEALKITGDSGPYLQYTHARIKGILRKAGGYNIDDLVIGNLKEEEEIILLKNLYRFGEEVELSALQVNPGVIYNYLIGLCQNFNTFYNKCSVLKASEKIKQARLVLIAAVAQVIKNGLQLLGIKAPEKM